MGINLTSCDRADIYEVIQKDRVVTQSFKEAVVMQDVLHDVEIDIINRFLRDGTSGVDHLVSLVVLDEEQLRIFDLWKQHITAMAELRDLDKLCRDALMLSPYEFETRYRFVDWGAAIEFTLISLAQSKNSSEQLYLTRVKNIFSRH